LDRLHHPARLFGGGMRSINDPPNRICRAFSNYNPQAGVFHSDEPPYERLRPFN